MPVQDTRNSKKILRTFEGPQHHASWSELTLSIGHFRSINKDTSNLVKKGILLDVFLILMNNWAEIESWIFEMFFFFRLKFEFNYIKFHAGTGAVFIWTLKLHMEVTNEKNSHWGQQWLLLDRQGRLKDTFNDRTTNWQQGETLKAIV